MGRMTGLEPASDIPSKVLATYEAVQELIAQGRDVNDISVAAITECAGIGKGTIYDYFDSKEEIIACSFLYYISNMAKRLVQNLSVHETLREQMNFLFDALDQDSSRKVGFVCFMHGATDNSKYSQMVKEKLQASKVGKGFPDYLVGDIVRKGVENGEINPELPVEYLVYTMFCKVFTYMMCIGTEDCFSVDRKQMRELIIEGILREIQVPGK